MFEDRTVSPTYICDAARATRVLLESRRAGRPVSLRQLRRVHVARVRARDWRDSSACRAGDSSPVRMADVHAARAAAAVLRAVEREAAAAGVAMPTWQDALSRYVHSIPAPG